MKQVTVPQYVDKPVPEYVNVEVAVDVDRNIPVPVEAITTFEYQLAQFRPRINKVVYPLYVPRFVEVPVAAELFDPTLLSQLQAQGSKLQVLSSSQALGLCDVENMATELRQTDVHALQGNVNLEAAILNAWKSGQIGVTGHAGGIAHRSVGHSGVAMQSGHSGMSIGHSGIAMQSGHSGFAMRSGHSGMTIGHSGIAMHPSMSTGRQHMVVPQAEIVGPNTARI